MAEHAHSARDIERDIEHERAELRDTLHEISSRLSFEDIWNRVGTYLRGNGSELGEGFARVAREKPVALGLTALGIGLLLFGPSDNPARYRRSRSQGADRTRRSGPRSPEHGDRALHQATRERLERARFEDSRASGPSDQRDRSDPWAAPHHREAPQGTGAASGAGSGTTGATHDAARRAAAPTARETTASSPPAKPAAAGHETHEPAISDAPAASPAGPSGSGAATGHAGRPGEKKTS